MNDIVLSVIMLAAFAMLGGSWFFYRRQGPNRQSLLMAILAFVMMANVVIWLVPVEGEGQPDSAAAGQE